MNGLNCRRVGLGFVTAVCLATSAFAAEIRDDAKLFSPDVVTAQQARLNEIQRAAHHDVTIETFATLPDGRAKDVEGMSAREKSEFYSNWLKQRAKARKAEGIFVLITKEPGHVEVGVSGKLQAAGYAASSKKALVETFLTAFRAKEFDRGLTDAVAQIEKDYGRLKAGAVATRPNAPAQAPRPMPVPAQPAVPKFSWMGIVLVVGAVIVGLMVLSSIMRAFSGGGSGQYGQGQYGPAGYGGMGNYGGGPYGAGGGGFGRGLMGGLLGGMAGSWLYDSFSGRSNQAHGSDGGGMFGGGGGAPTSSGDDTWSTSGGDFGGGGGFSGGDFGGGGGDFGGGDFSGGDSSGGDF